MTVAVHIANGNPNMVNVLRTAEDPGSAFGMFRIPTVAACHALMMSPIPNKFPELRWGFIEASAGWVPWVITEAKNRYQGAGRKFPDNVMKEYNIYVTMFLKVLKTFAFFLVWYSLFIVAFGLGFFILLHKVDDKPAGEDDYVFFNKV